MKTILLNEKNRKKIRNFALNYFVYMPKATKKTLIFTQFGEIAGITLNWKKKLKCFSSKLILNDVQTHSHGVFEIL